jgi:hypothetical protein
VSITHYALLSLSAALVLLSGSVLNAERRRRGRARRRGGYIRPRVSPVTSRITMYTKPATTQAVGSTSFSTPPGRARGDEAILRQLLRLSRLIEHGSSGNATEGAGASGARPVFVGFGRGGNGGAAGGGSVALPDDVT